MSKIHDAMRGGLRTTWTEYTDEEIVQAWTQTGQGHRQSLERGQFCVLVECDWFDAISISRLFIRNVFTLPTSCTYDGGVLSLYCGGAGSRALECYDRAAGLVSFWTHWRGGE